MVSYENFLEKFPKPEDLEKAYPVGKKIKWCDGMKYTVVCYITDKNRNSLSHLVIVKRYSKYGRRWYYNVIDSYVFYATVEMVERETKHKFFN